MNDDEKTDKAKNKANNKMKQAIKRTVLSIAKVALPIFLFILLILVIWYAVEDLISIEISSGVADNLDKSTSISENGEIVIDDEVYDKIRDSLKKQGINPKDYWLSENDYVEGTNITYLQKMVGAEIASNYPDTGVGDIRGIVKIQRNNEELKYKTNDEFEKMLNGAQSAENTDDISQCFTIDDDMNIIVGTYTSSKKTAEDGTVTTNYSVNKTKLNYKNLVSQYSMPFEFLFALLQTTENPEYVAKVADLVLEESEIVINIYDSSSTTVETTNVTWDEVKYSGETRNKNGYNYNVPLNFTSRTTKGPETTEETTGSGSVNLRVTKVKTWIYDKETEYEKCTMTNRSEGEPFVEDKTEGQVKTTKEKKDDEYIVKKSRIDIENKTTQVTTVTTIVNWQQTGENKEEINTDRFLGLWKNDTGEYEQGSLYNPEGNVVYYHVPKENQMRSPAKFITKYPNLLFEFLLNSEDTQNMERIMRYILYVYTGKDYGVTDPKELLEMFHTTTLSGTSATNLVDYIFNYITAYEGTTHTSGGNYVAQDLGDGAITIGHGMTNFAIGNLKPGDEIPAGVVDGMQKQLIKQILESIQNELPELTNYQLVAMVSFAYNGGSSQRYIIDGYRECWEDDRDNKYFTGITEADIPNLQKGFDLVNSRSASVGPAGCAKNEAIVKELKETFDTPLFVNYWAGYCHGTYKGQRVTYGGLVWRRWGEFMMFQYGYNVHDNTFFSGVGGSLANWEGETYQSAKYTFPVYNQMTGKWATHTYGRPPLAKTISSSGCGCCSISAIVSGYLGEAWTPDLVADCLDEMFPDGSYYVYGSGSTSKVWSTPFISQYFGCRDEIINDNRTRAIQALKDGYCVLGGEVGHILAFVPVSEEDARQGYVFRIIDSARGHNVLCKSFADADRVVRGKARPYRIIYPPEA